MKENKDWLHGLKIDKKNEKKENKEKGTETPKLKKIACRYQVSERGTETT